MSIIKTVGKHGFEVTEYKSEIGLVATYEGSDGKDWQKWGRERVGKDKYSDKDRPIKVILGDAATATMALLAALLEITGHDYVPGDQARKHETIPDDDVPF